RRKGAEPNSKPPESTNNALPLLCFWPSAFLARVRFLGSRVNAKVSGGVREFRLDTFSWSHFQAVSDGTFLLALRCSGAPPSFSLIDSILFRLSAVYRRLMGHRTLKKTHAGVFGTIERSIWHKLSARSSSICSATLAFDCYSASLRGEKRRKN